MKMQKELCTIREANARIKSVGYKMFLTGFAAGVVLTLMFIFITSCTPLPAQDTVPVTIVAEDTTFRPDLYYYVDDAYTDDIDSTKISNHYNQSIPGWDIDGTLFDLRFDRIEVKYKIETTLGRAWYTIEGYTRQEIWHDGQMFVTDSDSIWFQGKGQFKNK